MTNAFNLKALFASAAATAVVIGSVLAGMGAASQPESTMATTASATARQINLPPVTVVARRMGLTPVIIAARRVDLQPVTVVGHRMPVDTLVAGVQTSSAL